MLLQHLRALYLASGGHGSVWNYLGAPVRLTGVSGRFACGFRTVLHFADADMLPILPSTPGCFRNPLHRFNQLSNLSIVGLYSDYSQILPESPRD